MISPISRRVKIDDSECNRQSSLYSGDTTDDASSKSSGPSLRTDHYSATSSKSESQYKVSEIMNPDGSTTVRNLLIQDDGSWMKQEHRINDRRDVTAFPSRIIAARNTNVPYYRRSSHMSEKISTTKQRTSFEQDPRFDRYGRSPRSVDDLPGLRRSNSFDSTSSGSSREYTSRRRTGRREFTEAAAHRLRRQRLSQSPKLSMKSSVNGTARNRSCSPGRSSPIVPAYIPKRSSPIVAMTPPRRYTPIAEPTPSPVQSHKSFGQPQPNESVMLSPRTTSSAPTRMRSNSTPRDKRVAFSEPMSAGYKRTEMNSSPSDVATEAFGHYGCWLVQPCSSENPGVKRVGYKTSALTLHSNYSDDDTSIFADVVGTENAHNIASQPQHTPMKQKSAEKSKIRISYVDEEEQVPKLHSVTVKKASRDDRIGIFVHVGRFPFGKRLVVTKIAPAGKFANSGIQEGDIVVSINGENMVDDPNTQTALDIVGGAPDSVTIVVQKSSEHDGESVAQTSISSMSKDISSLAYEQSRLQMLRKRESEKRNDFVGNSNVERFEPKSMNINKVRHREKMVDDGSMLISQDTEIEAPYSITMNESWKLSGAIVVCVDKTHASEKPGIRVGIKKTSNGHCLYISDISPSSAFAKTPLRAGDVILSINNFSLYDSADVADAYSAMGNSGKRITLVARKGDESLTDFLRGRRRHPGIQKEDQSRAGLESMDSPLGLETVGTVGTTISGEMSNDETNGANEGDSAGKGGSLEEILGHKTQMGKRDLHQDTLESDAKDSSDLSKSTNEFDFDEESYGASLFGYNASSSVKFVKNSQDEDIGFEMQEIATEWGRLLVVSKVVSCSLASETDLKVGDAILAINGMSFRGNTSALRASAVVREAERNVYVEYQKLSSFSPAVPVNLQIPVNRKKDTRMLNTELFVGEKSVQLRHEPHQTVPPPGEGQGIDHSSLLNDSIVSPELKKMSSLERTQKSSPKRRRLRLIVTKKYKEQEVGIDLAISNNKLIVAGLSHTGMLRKAPLAYGDIIQSINGVNFQTDPNANEAKRIVNDAPEKVIFEVLKTTPVPFIDQRNNGISTKSCARVPLVCSRRSKVPDTLPQ